MTKNIPHVKICKNDAMAALDFALKTYKSHDSHHRTSSKVIEHILIGKIGEIAFKKLKDANISLTASKNPDMGFDCIDNNLKIDIKTLDDICKKRVYINHRYMNADIYVLMYFNKTDNIAYYLGSLSKSNIEANFKYDKKNLSYVDKELFIDRFIGIKIN